MLKSNIKFVSLGDGIEVNTTHVVFNEGEEVDISTKQRELLCVGNSTKHNMKIQITAKDTDTHKFVFTSNQHLMVLRKGEACEFKLFVEVLCTTKVESDFMLVANSYVSERELYKPISFSIVSKLSSKLDPDELKENTKLGEGSFGIVYKGIFRKEIVAIKKMREVSDTENAIIEFEKEVSMLDKFRSEFIVHFYGAVFVPNKVCMITEFAPFGNLQDLMKHYQSEEIDVTLRVKFMLDAAKGISYLHTNGILHRDIKPDNFLVFSLDLNQRVNAKLTDFGSARNVNVMMTNMTFTKGIGTPKYMGPEILNKNKYKKSADIYSFAITLLEVLTWVEPFPKEIYKFGWSIADLISIGKRPSTILKLEKKYQSIIENAWKQEPKERSDINTIIACLEHL
ncbi:serine/threonine protein kinase HT1, putative [Entamoeba invadens IP1]|uniref:Serine/threonine protein kinase HT1, putative n=1 Tax=Entamoeba invadens IP1 TaxID=370355 RepID=L7FNH1_ENTIV|nr:serine/threonine protein kinase HT1, putative [Entamoeba invadens IP1]ELP88535.1 serine/threonine protein kinase HT1, putative [Entamoeba invadens IP1]|eukprot:XP_004255306.1 serine/threonine protein kinase HT1, putative [Entamoeba invadens IP1]